MTCRNSSCCFEFCWLCLGPWSEHGTITGGFYKCNIWEGREKSGETKKDDLDREQAKTELERYTFYFERFDNHIKAMEALKANMEETEIRMSELMTIYKWTPNQTNFLWEAVKSVITARRILSWTYPIGFFMSEKFPLRELFYQYQKDLEIYTEDLHHLTVQPLEDLVAPEQKEKVINHTRQVKNYVKNLLQGIENEINPTAFG